MDVTKLKVKHTEFTVSSVRSNESTTSSGFVKVSDRKRKDVREVFPYYEPPPDYDDDRHLGACRTPGTKPGVSGPDYYRPTYPEVVVDGESTRPLLSQQPSVRAEIHNDSQQPLLSVSSEDGNSTTKSQTSDRRHIVRINTNTSGIELEIVSPVQSPRSPATISPMSVSSTAAEAAFIYPKRKTGKKRKCCKCCKCPLMVKVLAIMVGVLVIGLIFVILYFTVCLFPSTRACTP